MWEYKIETRKSYSDYDVCEEEFLEGFAKDRWELVAVFDTDGIRRFYFKRRIE